MTAEKTAITPRRDEDFPEWYQQVVRAAELAENSDVRGCMVIKPWGYGIWENMQRALAAMFRELGWRLTAAAATALLLLAVGIRLAARGILAVL